MNDTNANTWAVPPRIPGPNPPAPGHQPLGENAEEREPIPNLVGAIEAILRQPRRVIYQLRQPGAGRLISLMLIVARFFARLDVAFGQTHLATTGSVEQEHSVAVNNDAARGLIGGVVLQIGKGAII